MEDDHHQSIENHPSSVKMKMTEEEYSKQVIDSNQPMTIQDLEFDQDHRSTSRTMPTTTDCEEEDQEPIDTDHEEIDQDSSSIILTLQKPHTLQESTRIEFDDKTTHPDDRWPNSDRFEIERSLLENVERKDPITHPDRIYSPSNDPHHPHPSPSSIPPLTSTPSPSRTDQQKPDWTSPSSDIIDRSLIYDSTNNESLKGILPSPPSSNSDTILLSTTRLESGRSQDGGSKEDQDQIEAQERLPSIGTSTTSSYYASVSFSFWDQFKYQIDPNEDDDDQTFTGESTSSAALRFERISNFLHVPISIERMIYFGFLICLDSFLSVLTILPIKFVVSSIKLISTISARTIDRLGRESAQDPATSNQRQRPKHRLSVSSKVDLIQGLLIISVCVFLHHVTDASRMYHSVRGQETIKLYVIFNVLEIADRLCCSFGQDILDSLFSPSTLGRRVDGSQPHMKPLFLFILAFIFTVAHTLVLFYQLVSLNVAINSFDHSLMTLLISNQFVEIKGAVFKKFEKENLFQMSCADIVERFQLFLMLTIIALRNWIEMSGSSTTSSHAFSYTYQYLPVSLSNSRALSLIENIVSPVLVVMLSEVLVDWLKHAFITKFNHIRPSVYGRFIDVLCKDLVGEEKTWKVDQAARGHGKMRPFIDKSPAVSRRLGFSVFPIFCLTVRVVFQVLNMLSDTSDEEFRLFNDEDVDRLVTDDRSRFSFEYMKEQILTMITHSDMFNPNSPRHSDPPLNPPSPPASSSFSNLQIQGSIILSFMIVVTFLTIIKLYLGILIRSYSISRVQTIDQRLEEDQLNGRDRLPIGLSESEILKEKTERKLIERVEFDVPLRSRKKPSNGLNAPRGVYKSWDVDKGSRNFHSAGHHPSSSSHPSHALDPSLSQTQYVKKPLTMDELSRFDMVRSRIW